MHQEEEPAPTTPRPHEQHDCGSYRKAAAWVTSQCAVALPYRLRSIVRPQTPRLRSVRRTRLPHPSSCWKLQSFEKVVKYRHTKPEPERYIEPKIRPCLVCKTPFQSEWSGERICRRCKSAKIWRSSSVATQRGR